MTDAEGISGSGPTLGALLREFRARRGLTQRRLANSSRVPLRTISELERGRRRPSSATVQLLVMALGLDASDQAIFETAAAATPATLEPQPADAGDAGDERWFAREVLRGLLDSITPGPRGTPRWDAAEPYLLRQAIAHAVDADQVDLLLADLEFLVHADPHSLQSALDSAASPNTRLLAAVYRASSRYHEVANPSARRQLLALDAARYGDTWLSQLLATPGDLPTGLLRPAWASSAQVDSGLLHTVQRKTWTSGLAITSVAQRLIAIVGGYDHAVELYDLEAGEPVGLPLLGHQDVVRSVATARLPDGRSVAATVGDDGTMRLWDLQAGVPIGLGTGSALRVSERGVNAVVLAAVDGRLWAATGGQDRLIRVWDVASGERLHELPGHDGAVRALAVAGPGRPVLLSAGEDGRALLWSLEDGAFVQTVAENRGWLTAAALSTMAGRLVAALGGTRGVQVVDVTTGEPDFGDSSASVYSVAFAGRSEELLLYAGQDGTVWAQHLRQSGAPTRAFVGHTLPVFAVVGAVSQGRPVAVSTGADATIRVWDPNATVVGPSRDVRPVHSADVSGLTVAELPGGAVAFSGGQDAALLAWSLDDGARSGPSIDLTALPTFVDRPAEEGYSGREIMAVHATREPSQRLVLATADGSLRQWDLVSGEPLGHLGGDEGPVNALASVQADGRSLLLSGGDDMVARVWDLHSGTLLSGMLGHRDWINTIDAAVHEGTPLAATAGNDGLALLWNLVDFVQLGQALRADQDAVNAVLLAEAGGQLLIVTAGDDTTIKVWDAEHGDVVRTLVGHTQPVRALALLEREQTPYVISGGTDAVLRVWHLETGRQVAAYHLPEAIAAMVTSVNGEIVIAFGWEVATFATTTWPGAMGSTGG